MQHQQPGYAPAPPALPSQPPPLQPGTMVGKRYLIQGYIGGGGFGHIYKAQDTVLGHRRALKEAFYRDQLTQRQFRLEAEFVLNTRHPNLVEGYAVFEEAGRFYLVMDYVDGHTVEELTISHIRATGCVLPEAQILDWIIPICDAASALHSQPRPIIHRDVKPANIKLTRRGVPVLIDLGLAKLFIHGTNTIGAALAFTPGYAPPEQYQAAGATDQRTDVYGLGASLYYLLTGYQPTEAPARLSAHALPAPRALNPALAERTEAAVLKAMALDPNERQQSAHELMADLQQARALLAGSPPFVVAAVSPSAGRPVGCTRCGTGNPQSARFCMRCGSPLVGEHETAGPRRSAPPAASDTLAEVARAEAGERPAPVASGAPAETQAPAVLARPVAVDEPVSGALAPPARVAEALPIVPEVTPAAPAHDSAPGGGGQVAPFAAAAPPPPPQKFPALRGLPGAVSRALLSGQVTDPAEATAFLAAVLSLIAFSASVLAVFAGWMIVFTLPALALAGWSFAHQGPRTSEDARTVTLVALVLSVGWFILWLAFIHGVRV